MNTDLAVVAEMGAERGEEAGGMVAAAVDQWRPFGCATLVEYPRVPSELHRPQAQAIGMLATGPLGMYGHVLATGPPPPRPPPLPAAPPPAPQPPRSPVC